MAIRADTRCVNCFSISLLPNPRRDDGTLSRGATRYAFGVHGSASTPGSLPF